MGKKESRAAAKAKGKSNKPVAKKPEQEEEVSEPDQGETGIEQAAEEFTVELKDEQVRDANFYSDVIKIEKYLYSLLSGSTFRMARIYYSKMPI
jgi:hypothetical protein